MHAAIIILNLIVSLASGVWGVVALWAPALMSKSSQATSGEVFYSKMYAVRAIPVGVATGLLPLWLGGSAIAWLLVVACAIQLADVWVAITKREVGMVTGASVAAAVHLACAFVVRTG